MGNLTVAETLSFAHTCQVGKAPPSFDVQQKISDAKVQCSQMPVMFWGIKSAHSLQLRCNCVIACGCGRDTRVPLHYTKPLTPAMCLCRSSS